MLRGNNPIRMCLSYGGLRSPDRLLLLIVVVAVALSLPGRSAADGGHDNNPGNNGPGNNGPGNNGPGNNGNGHGRRDPGQFTGTFSVIVRGFFTSDPQAPGTASVTATAVSFHAQVKDDSGRIYQLDATNLTIGDNYHFSGSGSVGGGAVTIDGHVDPPDPDVAHGGHGHDRQVVSAARFQCTYTTNDHHNGRVVGSIQSPAGGGQAH